MLLLLVSFVIDSFRVVWNVFASVCRDMVDKLSAHGEMYILFGGSWNIMHA